MQYNSPSNTKAKAEEAIEERCRMQKFIKIKISEMRNLQFASPQSRLVKKKYALRFHVQK